MDIVESVNTSEVIRKEINTEEFIDEVSQKLLQLEQADCPVVHSFGPNLYIRQVTMPVGTLAVGHYQKTTHLNVMLKGKVQILNSNGTTSILEAPQSFIAPPGRKCGVVLEEMVWLNIYSTSEKDIPTLETMFLDFSPIWDEFIQDKNKLLLVDKTNEDRDDYNLVLEEFGYTEEQVLKEVHYPHDQMDFPFGSYKVLVSASKIAGMGLFATSNIEPLETIAPVRIANKRTPAGRYTNHSKNPNAFFLLKPNGDLDLVAKKPIAGQRGGLVGEEITIDYRQALSLRSN
jgi:hypothetical protein